MQRSGLKSRGIFRPRRGTEVIELALLLLPLLWITFGAIDFGYYFYLAHNVQAAASAGARAGIVPGASQTQIDNAVALVMDNAGLSQSKTGYTVAEAVDSSNSYLTVTVSMPYTPMGIPPARVPIHTVQSTATWRIETY